MIGPVRNVGPVKMILNRFDRQQNRFWRRTKFYRMAKKAWGDIKTFIKTMPASLEKRP